MAGSSIWTSKTSSEAWIGGHLRSFLDRRVRDGVIRRAIGKWLNAGVMEAGELSYPQRGTPQGGVASPVLSNVYLHAVLDEWFEHEVKPRLRRHDGWAPSVIPEGGMTHRWRRVLLTGAGGNLGRNLRERLGDVAGELVVTDRADLVPAEGHETVVTRQSSGASLRISPRSERWSPGPTPSSTSAGLRSRIRSRKS